MAQQCRTKDGLIWPGDLLLQGSDLVCPPDEELKCVPITVKKSSQMGCCCELKPTTTTLGTTSKFFRRYFARFFKYFESEEKEDDFSILKFVYRAAPPALLNASPKTDLPLAINECHFLTPDDKTNPVPSYM